MRTSTFWMIIGFVFFWNSGFIGAEYGLRYADPFTFMFWRYAIFTVFLVPILLVRGSMRWPGVIPFACASFVGVMAHGVWLVCVFLSLSYDVPAGIVALIVALQPMVTGAFSGLVTGEKTPLHRWVGLIIGFCGVVITVSIRIDMNDRLSILGYVLPFLSVLGITIASLFQRRLELYHRTWLLPVDQSLFYQSIATTSAMVFPAIFFEHLATQWHPVFIFSLAWLIIGISLGAYAFMWILISRIDATRVASLFYLGPPVTMVMAWVCLGDTLQLTDMVGLGVVLLGVVITLIQPRQSRISP